MASALNHKWPRAALVASITLCVVVASLQAKKPAPEPEPDVPAPGVILYKSDDGLINITPDGTVLELETPSSGLPSHNTYDGIRWWITLKQTGDSYIVERDDGTTSVALQADVFASTIIEGVPIDVQLTDFFGNFIVQGSPGRESEWDRPAAQWSNDGLDSFFSITGLDVSNAVSIDTDGNYVIDYEDLFESGSWGIVRINKFATEIDLDFDPVAWTDECVEPILEWSSLHGSYSWSPDGTKLVAAETTTRIDCPVWVVDAPDDGVPVDLASLPPIFQGDGIALQPYAWSPSPDEAKIVLGAFNLEIGNHIATIRPDGSDFHVVVDYSKFTGIEKDAYWSPDSEHVVYVKVVSKPKAGFVLERMRLSDGATVEIVSDTSEMLPMQWVTGQ